MFNFGRKDMEYFAWFVESAQCFNQGAKVMHEVMVDYSAADEKMKRIVDLEHAADAINDKIIDKLNMTFITPIDREDIYYLANGLDDGVDLLHGTLQRIVMYHTGEAMPGAVSLTKLIIDATQEIINAFSLLTDIPKNQVPLLDATHKISKLESEGDDVFRQEVAVLFKNQKDPIELIKWKDILENLEDTLDHCERIADMLRGVVMKYA
ncbi:MAG: DUF47 domain-containing protein [Selenomonadaceae bacterium]|nr:DUF47 domain-containing protein [Selenomonadaceae bacterium]